MPERFSRFRRFLTEMGVLGTVLLVTGWFVSRTGDDVSVLFGSLVALPGALILVFTLLGGAFHVARHSRRYGD